MNSHGSTTREYKYKYRTIGAIVHELVTRASKFDDGSGEAGLQPDYKFEGFYGEPCTSDVLKRAGNVLFQNQEHVHS